MSTSAQVIETWKSAGRPATHGASKANGGVRLFGVDVAHQTFQIALLNMRGLPNSVPQGTTETRRGTCLTWRANSASENDQGLKPLRHQGELKGIHIRPSIRRGGHLKTKFSGHSSKILIILALIPNSPGPSPPTGSTLSFFETGQKATPSTHSARNAFNARGLQSPTGQLLQ